MTNKQQIHSHCLQVVNDKIRLLQQVLADLKESGANETKSTAGDKHETALAMLQIEQANTRSQLQDVVNKKAVLDKINPALVPIKVVQGSLVKTDKGYLYLAIALGRVNLDGLTITVLSPQSPLGSKLMGLSTGDSVEMNGTRYTIATIE